MDFCVLGPLEVWDRGRRFDVRRPKHRALLAALLLRVGSTVSVDQLLDDLWGERPPLTARGSLQNMVSGLRKQLGEAALRTESPGYRLEVEPERVDLFRFERLVEEARSAADAEERVKKLRDALALWRGPPLADLAFEPFVLLEAPRLEGLRLAAQEELIEARLALGEHTQVLPELEALVSEHPFDERLRGQLMLALYRAGRQAEALQAYRNARDLLVEELGLEPSAPLRELEQAILRHHPALSPSSRVRQPAFPPMRKTACVLVARLVNWDALEDEYDPETRSRLLDRQFAAVQETVERHSGTVERFFGDVAVAIFGVPKAYEDDALRALRAAVELRDEVSGAGDEPGLQIGVDTGEVFVSESASAGVVTGAVLDAAKRLAEAASGGEILLGAGVVRLVRNSASTQALDPVGLQEGRRLAAWRLLELIEGAPAIPRHLEAPLVGRRGELAQLRRAFESARDQSSCRLVVLAGEAGIGKTRLIGELVAEVGREAQVLVGRCASYGEGATWLPLAEILRGAGAEKPEVLRTLLAAEPDAALVGRRVAGAIGVSDEAAPLEETNRAIRRLFEVLARERPLLLVFEDVHWAEPTLLDLIDYLGVRASGPILLLCVTRPELLETRSDWANRAITLAALPEADVHALVEALPGDLDAEARARVVEVAEGNPLFAEQLVAHAWEEGSESLDGPPPSIEALLASRLDLLSAAERAFLRRAAVLGRRFPRAALLELSAENPSSTEADLRSLTAKGFVRGGATDESLSFHHVLMRNVAYAGIPKTERADLHERAAEWLDNHITNPDELVGHHLEQAYRCLSELQQADEPALNVGKRAAGRLASAAERAMAREDMLSAAALLARAEALLPPLDPLRPRLLTQRGRALRWLFGDLGQAAAVLDKAIRCARAVDDRRSEWAAVLEASFVRRMTEPNAWIGQARQEIERAIEACETLGYERGLATAWRMLGLLEADLGDADAAGQALERALMHARRSQDPRVERLILGVVGFLAVRGSMHVDDAIPLLELHQELARARGYSLWEADCDEDLAVLWAMRGEFRKAYGLLDDARTLNEYLGNPVASAQGNRSGAVHSGAVRRLAGDLAAAECDYRNAERFYEEQGNLASGATVAAELAHVLHDQSRDNEAFELTETSEAKAPSFDAEAQALWRGARAKVLACRGQPDEAEQLAFEAVEIASATDNLLLRADRLMDLAVVLRRLERAKEAASAIERALPLYDQKGNLVLGKRARELLEEIKTSVSAAC
jgi:DNA-binding SARP family transcriptional activator